MFELDNKVAIVTGSTRGIGKSIATQLASAGAKVIISGRKQETCDLVSNELNNKGFFTKPIACHVGDKDQINDLINQTIKEFGCIDILVSNAATNPSFGPISKLEDKAFDKIMDVNVKASIWLSNLVAKHMVKKKKGSIIILSSITAILGTDNIGAYGISKAAEAALVRNLAVELGPEGIRVNGIAPGLIKTDFSRALWENPSNLKRQENLTPLRRIGTPDDIAGIAHFLACEASSFITGQLIIADGGETIAWT
tara:strand:+ start:121 stop:882 length:762 start_codon:yes stop_codon:yes gene_type:complete